MVVVVVGGWMVGDEWLGNDSGWLVVVVVVDLEVHLCVLTSVFL